MVIYVVSLREVLKGLTGGGRGVEAVLRVGGGVAVAEKPLLARGQVGFGSSGEGAAKESKESKVRLSR